MFSLVSISSNIIAGHIINNVRSNKEFLCSSRIIEKVEKDIMSFNLPHTLEENIKNAVKTLIGEVQMFNNYMTMCGVKVYPNFVLKFFFTVEGKIDYKLTTHQIVLDKNVDIKTRVILACKFCFEEEVLAFWKSQPDTVRQVTKQEEMPILTKWLKCLEETEEPLKQFLWKDSILLKAAFSSAVDEINVEAAEYFWKKMTALPDEEKIDILEKARDSFYLGHLPNPVTSNFIRRMKLFLVRSQLKEYTECFQNLTLTIEMLYNKFNCLKNKLVIFKNKKGKLENENLNNEKGNLENGDMSKEVAEILDKEVEVDMLKNECVMKTNHFEATINNKCNMLINELRLLMNI